MFDMKEYKKQWYSENPNYNKIYYKTHREKIRKDAKNWYTNNYEKALFTRRMWRKNNPDKFHKAINAWHKNIKNRERKRMYWHTRQALIYKAGRLNIKTIQMIYEDNIKRFGTLTCYLCEKPIMFSRDELEHKIPLSRGGTNEYNNLAIACKRCNVSKHNKTLEEYLQSKLFREGIL